MGANTQVVDSYRNLFPLSDPEPEVDYSRYEKKIGTPVGDPLGWPAEV